MNKVKTLTLMLALVPWLCPGRAQADEQQLEALAKASREAALQLDNPNGSGGVLNGFGVFISEDGLALVPLSGVALEGKPKVLAADGTPLRFGEVLGLFPAQELALMKFRYRPRNWLRIAAQDPEVAESIALVTLQPDPIRDSTVAPAIGPVTWRGSGMTTMSRIFRFVRIFNLGVRLDPLQKSSSGAGTFGINGEGELVGIMNGTGSMGASLASVVDLVDEIEAMVVKGEALPFPLPEDLNTNDNALMDGKFSDYHQASKRGDENGAQLALKRMLERYPDSPALRSMAGRYPKLFDDPLAMFPEPGADDPAGQQVNLRIARGAVLASRNNDYPAAIVELEKAVEQSPDDFGLARFRLGHIYLYLNRFDEAEPLLRQAYEGQPDDLGTAVFYYQLLTRLGKNDEAATVVAQITKLAEVYGFEEEVASMIPGAADSKMPADTPRGPNARLIELAGVKRGAALKLNRAAVADLPGPNSFGAFISEDGLALVGLLPLAGKETPSVDAADGTPIPFGEVLGVFPEYELALVKFDYRPEVWLKLASEEPEVGDRIALIPLDGRGQASLMNRPVPPVVGPVMEKRSSLTGNLSEARFVSVVVVGAGVTREQGALLTPGTFGIDRRGDLVAFHHSLGGSSSQPVMLPVPVVALADRIAELAETGKALPFPLRAADNPIDPAIREADFARLAAAQLKGEHEAARELLRSLLDRYPTSVRLYWMGRKLAEPGAPVLTLADLPEPDPGTSAAQQVSQWVMRGATPNPLPQTQYERAVRDYEQAIALSPEDYPYARLALADLFVTMQRFDDAERLFAEVYPIASTEIYYLERYEKAMVQKGNLDEVLKIAKRINELREIFRVR